MTCSNCGTIYDMLTGELKRQTKRGRDKFYCSLTCFNRRPEHIARIKKYSYPNFVGGSNKIKTEEGFLESSMRNYIRRCKTRDKGKNFEGVPVSTQYLIELWKKQKGECTYTKVNLILPHEKEYSTATANYKASLDRIDSSKGYIEGNVQFVSITVNLLKSDLKEEHVIDFFRLIKKLN